LREYLMLFKFIRPHMRLFAASGVCMVLSAIFDGVSLGMIMPVADIILTGKKMVLPGKMPAFVNGWVDSLNSVAPLVLLNYMAVAVVVLFLLKGLFGFLQGYFMNDISQRVVRDVRSQLYSKFHDLSLDYFTHMRGGELMSRVTNDVGTIGNALSTGATDLIYQSLQVAVFCILIFFTDAKLALISLVLVPLISFPIIKVGAVLKKIARQGQEKMADINSFLYETIIGVRVVKAFNMEEAESKKFNDTNYSCYKLAMKSSKRMLLLGPLTELMGIAAGVFVLVLKGREVISGKISFGVMAVSLAALLSMVRPFKRISQVHAIFQQAIAGSNRIHDVLETTPSVKEARHPKALDGFREKIVFDNVSFNYGHNAVLKNINLQINNGEVLAIVGPSGAGKTTLLDLIPRFYDPVSGRVLIDGVDLRELRFKSLRANIGIVTQETVLFNDTIRGNIAYGMPNATQEEVEAAAKKAHIHDVISRMKKSYDTVIGDRGVRLSGGERQRLAIARAILKDAPILILDEATSQLDSESERLVQEAINLLIKGRTVFVIAHRLSTIRNATRILVLSEGKTVEEGTHEELLNKGGLYKKLYQNQQIRE
jgi:ATP-binding cassette, subfamily B, bacterial MsbA